MSSMRLEMKPAVKCLFIYLFIYSFIFLLCLRGEGDYFSLLSLGWRGQLTQLAKGRILW